MAFSKYPKIESVRRVSEDLGGRQVWVLEKIHGSNGSIVCKLDGTFQVGKRTGFLTEGDKFCNGFELAEKYHSNLMHITEDLITSDTDSVCFYGEFYGGLYNGETNHSQTKVQRKVDYSPSNEFAVFDIVVRNEDSYEVLSWNRVKSLCDSIGIPRVPEVCNGYWDEISKTFDVESLRSLVPRTLHGLTDVSSPACEGVIIRDDSKDNDGWGIRCKWKQAWMDEICESKSRVDSKTNSGKVVEALGYMNEPRFTSYLSKVGSEFILDKKNMSQNMRDMVDDAISDIKIYVKIDERVDGELCDFLGGLRKGLSKKARMLIVDYWNSA
jgi:Rnl2 family RNA ligase